MNNACFSLTVLLSAIASMLLVGPAECQMCDDEISGLRVCHNFPCDATMGWDLLDEIHLGCEASGSDNVLVSFAADPCVGPVLLPITFGGRAPLPTTQDTRLEAVVPEYREGRLSIGTGVRRQTPGRAALSGSLTATASRPAAPLSPANVQDLRTGYDADYDAAMTVPADRRPRDELWTVTRLPEARFEGLASLRAALSRSRTAGVLRRGLNGDLWRRSADWQRRARLEAAADRAGLSQLAASGTERELALKAADTLEGLGVTIHRVATRLRSWAADR